MVVIPFAICSSVIGMSKKDIIKELREDRAKRIEELKETIAEHNPEALFADGFDNAMLGYSTDYLITRNKAQQILLLALKNEGYYLYNYYHKHHIHQTLNFPNKLLNKIGRAHV